MSNRAGKGSTVQITLATHVNTLGPKHATYNGIVENHKFGRIYAEFLEEALLS